MLAMARLQSQPRLSPTVVFAYAVVALVAAGEEPVVSAAASPARSTGEASRLSFLPAETPGAPNCQAQLDQIAALKSELQKNDDKIANLTTQLKAAQRHADDALTDSRHQQNVVYRLRHAGSMIGRGLAQVADALQACAYQKSIALVAGSLGIISILDPPIFTEAVCMAVFSFFGGMIAHEEVTASWTGSITSLHTYFVSFEVAVFVGVAVAVGWKGFQIFLGAVVGLGVPVLLSRWAFIGVWEPNMTVAWYASCVLIGVGLMTTLQRNASAALGPLLGGLLCASFVGFLILEVASWFGGAGPGSVFGFAASLVSGAAPTAGAANVARLSGLFVWAVTTLAGIVRWFCGLHLWLGPPRSLAETLHLAEAEEPWLSYKGPEIQSRAPPAPRRIAPAPPMPPPRGSGQGMGKKSPYDIY